MYVEAWEKLMDLAVSCFAIHLISTASLSWRVGDDQELTAEIFGRPVWAQRSRGFMALLNLKYFWPFSKSPEQMATRPLVDVGLFWVARLAGTGIATFLVLFLLSAFLVVGH